MKVYFFDSLESTNSYALQIARKGALDNTIVMARTQTAGRGRFLRPWFSPVGSGLYLSIIKIPTSSIIDPQTVVHSVAERIVVATKTATEIKLEIEWPNDLLLNGKKVGGILIESFSVGEIIKAVVIGVGLNINTVDFPDELKQSATSLYLETKKTYPVDIITELISNELKTIKL